MDAIGEEAVERSAMSEPYALSGGIAYGQVGGRWRGNAQKPYERKEATIPKPSMRCFEIDGMPYETMKAAAKGAGLAYWRVLEANRRGLTSLDGHEIGGWKRY